MAHRRREFGVRRALGAGAAQITGTVLREGLLFSTVGCVFGLGGAALAERVLQSQLYAVRPGDPLSYGAAVTLILLASIVACAIPAYRAIAVSPMDALHTE